MDSRFNTYSVFGSVLPEKISRFARFAVIIAPRTVRLENVPSAYYERREKETKKEEKGKGFFVRVF